MSKWDNFKKSVGDIADKTVNKTKELTDTAALKLKIANKEADRDIEYKRLGKLAYVKLKGLEGCDSTEMTERIAASLEHLDRILGELKGLKAEEESKKNEKATQKAAKKAEKKKEEEADEELNMAVMTEFHEARIVADEEYEKAKAAAEEIK